MMNRSIRISILALSASFLAAACGDSTPTGLSATLSINSPENNATVNIPAPPQAQLVPVNFETNWTLKAKGLCGKTDHCGHVYVYVDSTDCNSPGLAYNAIAVSGTAQADFGRCATPTGQHTITLELRDDAGAVVKDLIGDNMTDAVAVNAQ